MRKNHVFFVSVFLVAFFCNSSIASAYYQDDDGRYIVNEDETWNKDNTYVFDHEVVVDMGAKLIIEPGTTISFRRDDNGDAVPFSVYDGQVQAIGTETEPIVFRREGDDGAFYINFDDGSNKTSVFKYVRFLEGGDAWYVDACTDCQQSLFEGFFVHRAMAAQQKAGTETLRYSYGKLLIENSVFSKSAFMDVWAQESGIGDIFDEDGKVIGKDPARLNISNSDFSGDTTVPALQVYDSHCPFADPNCLKKITFNNNWYSSPSGPNATSNSQGTGKQVIGAINLNGWSTSQFFCLENCHSSVMFLPGFEGSRLLEGSQQVWEPRANFDVERLYLDKGNNISVGGIIDEVNITPVTGIVNIYKTFVRRMDAMKNIDHLIKDWKPVAYDWRLSYDEILADASIENSLRDLALNSNTGKVTIVAHSNGGLLAKALMKKIGDADTAKLIDKVIFVAVPQVGTPEAIIGMLNGEKQEITPMMDERTARGLSENMPGAYQLLPSDEYFSVVQTPVVTFDISDSSDLKGRYGDKIESKGGLDDFLDDGHRRVSAIDDDIHTPSSLKGNLIDAAKNVHSSLDGWDAPDGVRVVQIAGWGVPSTTKGVEYFSEKKKHCDESLCTTADYLRLGDIDSTIDGDGTVVFPSALYMDGGAERYYVDLAGYNKSLDRISNLQLLGIDHKNILEIPELTSFIVDSVSKNLKPIADYDYLSTEIPDSDDENRIQYSLHSPLTLDLYDDQGRHTGVTADGIIEEKIPGTYYKQFGDVKFIFADESSSMHVSMSGYAAGTFTFSVKELHGDTELGEVVFKDMPTTSETEVTFDMPSDLAHAGDLHIDVDGDEAVDYQLQPKIGEVVTFGEKDEIAPTTTLSLFGTQGTNGWYTSDVTVTLSATDNDGGSDIEKKEYSLDNGTTWTAYADSFVVSTEGTMTLQYRSIDKAGNQEEMKTETVKIDKIKPIITGTALPAADANGWNTTDVEVRFVCTDSGVSQSGIETDMVAGSTLTSEGKGQSVTNTGECTDKAGNQAILATVSGINIDKTAPEAKISFNPTTQKLDISGTDNLSDVSVTLLEKQELTPSNKKVKKIKDWFSKWHGKHKKNLPDMLATITDQASHTTSLSFEKQENKGNAFVRLLSIEYDGEEENILRNASLGYTWRIDRKGQYLDFSSSLITEDIRLFSTYLSKQDRTLILEQERRHLLRLTSVDGMTVPYLESEKGKMKFEY